MDPAYKALPLGAADLAFKSDGHSFTGYVARYGNVDLGGDSILPGAFDATLKARARRPLLWQHDTREPIGVEQSLKSDANGLLGHWSLVDTQRGQDAYKLLKAGAISGMSIGYVPTEVEFAGDVRKLLGVDLLESSVVTLPMNEDAQVQSVKAQWDDSYVSSLPDSAFALVTTDDNGNTVRKLPHHDKGGALDMPHLRNALSRCPQMTGVSDAQRAKAEAHLKRHMDAADGGPKAHPDLDFEQPLETLLDAEADRTRHVLGHITALYERRKDEFRAPTDAHKGAVVAYRAEVEALWREIDALTAQAEMAKADRLPHMSARLQLRLALLRQRDRDAAAFSPKDTTHGNGTVALA